MLYLVKVCLNATFAVKLIHSIRPGFIAEHVPIITSQLPLNQIPAIQTIASILAS